ncbi:hypothetical protein Acor_55190 [Acrocarpospora corrugata]|uniref:CATRA-Associated Small Protein domain-containing protein n=1 Tax=Acrocarpospora corrugata TaxID=35763 RepID=A0A5M3W8E1_9ACTN|nr:CATRA system-associated protein [Acrocarpospora corrugata]GES03453.1 hypothetical protein Acor_55190 [Acrocarpospora corrugata]
MSDNIVTAELRVEVSAVLDAVLNWRLFPAGWNDVERCLDEMIESCAAGPMVRLSAATTRLMLLTPRRQVRTNPLELPERAPAPVRDRINTLRSWLSGDELEAARGERDDS